MSLKPRRSSLARVPGTERSQGDSQRTGAHIIGCGNGMFNSRYHMVPYVSLGLLGETPPHKKGIHEKSRIWQLPLGVGNIKPEVDTLQNSEIFCLYECVAHRCIAENVQQEKKIHFKKEVTVLKSRWAFY